VVLALSRIELDRAVILLRCAIKIPIPVVREPTQVNAKRTLTIIIVLLIFFIAGIALLCRAYDIGVTDPTSNGYQSILSQLISALRGVVGSITSGVRLFLLYSHYLPIRPMPTFLDSLVRLQCTTIFRMSSKFVDGVSCTRMESLHWSGLLRSF
jgi:hypothetical protein